MWLESGPMRADYDPMRVHAADAAISHILHDIIVGL